MEGLDCADGAAVVDAAAADEDDDDVIGGGGCCGRGGVDEEGVADVDGAVDDCVEIDDIRNAEMDEAFCELDPTVC